MKTLCVTFMIYINLMVIAGCVLKKNWNSKHLRFNRKPNVYGFNNRYEYTHDVVPDYKSYIQSPPVEDIADSRMDEYSFDDENRSVMNHLSVPSGCALGTMDVGRQLCMHCRQYLLMLKGNACFYERFKHNCPFTWQMYCLMPYMSVDLDMLRVGSKRIIVMRSNHANQQTRFVF